DATGDRGREASTKRLRSFATGRREARGTDGKNHRRGENPRMVSGTGGVGAEGAGEPQYSGRSAASGNERGIEPAHQASRNFPAVRAIDSGGSERRMV